MCVIVIVDCALQSLSIVAWVFVRLWRLGKFTRRSSHYVVVSLLLKGFNAVSRKKMDELFQTMIYLGYLEFKLWLWQRLLGREFTCVPASGL